MNRSNLPSVKIKVNIALMIISFFSIPRAIAQFDVQKNKYAFERTSYERWDNFKPKLYFDLFAKKYKKTDKRTMATRSVTMSLFAISADNYKIYSRSVDSIYKIETNKALDKTLNKNYILFQRSRANKLSEDFDVVMERAFKAKLSNELLSAFQDIHLGVLDNISFLKSSYAPDADKYPLIEKELAKLEEQLKILTRVTQLQEFIEDGLTKLPPTLIDGAIQETQLEINTIKKN